MNTQELTKQQLLETLKISESELDTAMLDCGIDYEQATYTYNDLTAVAKHLGIDLAGDTPALSSAELTIADNEISDDQIIQVAESTGVDLEVVMSAASHVDDLEALVKYVEAYQEFQHEQDIKDAAREHFEIDQLRKKEQALGDRLGAALTKKPVKLGAIRERIGMKVAASTQSLGKWDGKPGSEGEPDFLKNARERFATLQS